MLKYSRDINIYTRKFPLHNILAEETIIGFLLSNQSLKKTVSQSINRYFFSLKKYQALYDCILITNKKIQSITILEIIRILWDTKLLIEIGGINNVVHTIQKSQSLYLSYNENTSLKYFVNILHYYYIKRLFVQYSHSIIEINYFYNLSINQIYQKSIISLKKISQIDNRHKVDHLYHHIKNFLYNINENSKEKKNIFSGFIDLDKITNGFNNGDLIIIAGRPSMGKTSFAINILYYLSIKLNLRVHMFSLEMSRDEILNKLISLISNITINRIQARIIHKQDWQLVQQTCKSLINAPLSIDDNGYSSIDYIKSECQNTNINKSIIIIDYLQLIKVEQKYVENRAQEIGNITRELKLLAQNIKSIAIVLSQLNRNIENRADKRPLLSDLRESGCIDYANIPKIQSYHLVETINCFKQFYFLNRRITIRLCQNLEQHIFCMINSTRVILGITHNHRLLNQNIWIKEDQIKSHQFHYIKQNNPLNSQLTLEINRFFLIKRFNRNKVYDLVLSRYHNFTIESYIVHNSIEQDADLILMLYKDSENIDPRIIDIVVAKHRHGPVGTFQLLFYADICKFSNLQDKSISTQLLI